MTVSREKLTLVNVNPCKACFPLGVATAFYGLAKSLTLLHGSQGCSVYIRRHMATHYDEPVDIASTSLTEEGTVFGGEANLMKGLDNLIRLYEPEAIGVGTTCLAETIGEDAVGLVKKYQAARPNLKTKLIAVPSPGYGGTQYEGWFKGCQAVVAALAEKTPGHGGINVFAPPSSPADLRALKKLFDESGLPYVLFPDLSENLDRPYNPVYKRLPEGGTPLAGVKAMAGARASLELSRFSPTSLSPGEFLAANFGVPLIRLNPPIGLRDNDALLTTIKDLGGRVSPETISQRGRYLDAMLDAHKYNALGRLGIFGDPDLAYGLTRLALENGLSPTVVATGGAAPTFATTVLSEIDPVAKAARWSKLAAVDEADFDLIERLAVENEVNLLVGSSEGRRLAEKRSWPLIRLAFPVHDRQGGGRIRVFGFDGAIMTLDNLTNAIREREETTFRSHLKATYLRRAAEPLADLNFRPTQVAAVGGTEPSFRFNGGPDFGDYKGDFRDDLKGDRPANLKSDFKDDAKATPVRSLSYNSCRQAKKDPDPATLRPAYGLPSLPGPPEAHPCFSLTAARSFARLHLPVARDCNLSCGYCRRDCDCPNESRPGVASALLTPDAALARFLIVKDKLPNLTVVGVAGPGESLANFAAVAETFQLIKRYDPKISFCLSTNGLSLPRYVRDIKDLGVQSLSITINAIDPLVGAKIYGSLTYLGRTYAGVEGASLLLANQLGGLKMAVDLGLLVKVNTVILPGLNLGQAVKVAQEAAALGATVGNVMRHIPVPNTPFGDLPQVSQVKLRAISWESQAYLPQIRHCQQCRADAVGLLGEDLSYLFRPELRLRPKEELEPTAPLAPDGLADPRKAPDFPALVKVAVVSNSGVIVDRHFGQATRFFVYETDGESLRLIANQKVDLGPLGGHGGGFCGLKDALAEPKPEGFIVRLVAAAATCDAVVATRFGQSPLDKLTARGVTAFASYDAVDQAVLAAAKVVLDQRSLAKSG